MKGSVFDRDGKPQLPINKRWPGRYAFRVVVYTPTGGRLEIEGPHSEAEAKAVLAILLPSHAEDSAPPESVSHFPDDGGPGSTVAAPVAETAAPSGVTLSPATVDPLPSPGRWRGQ